MLTCMEVWRGRGRKLHQLSQGGQVPSIFKFPVINCCTLITQAETEPGQTGRGCFSVTRNTFC